MNAYFFLEAVILPDIRDKAYNRLEVFRNKILLARQKELNVKVKCWNVRNQNDFYKYLF